MYKNLKCCVCGEPIRDEYVKYRVDRKFDIHQAHGNMQPGNTLHIFGDMKISNPIWDDRYEGNQFCDEHLAVLLFDIVSQMRKRAK